MTTPAPPPYPSDPGLAYVLGVGTGLILGAMFLAAGADRDRRELLTAYGRAVAADPDLDPPAVADLDLAEARS